MDPLFASLFYNVALLAFLLLLQPLVRDISVGFKYTVSNFDERVDEGVFARRLAMVKDNQVEALMLWFPLISLASILDTDSTPFETLGLIFTISRVAYAVVSLAGIPVLRSAVWAVGFGVQIYLGYLVFSAL